MCARGARAPPAVASLATSTVVCWTIESIRSWIFTPMPPQHGYSHFQVYANREGQRRGHLCPPPPSPVLDAADQVLEPKLFRLLNKMGPTGANLQGFGRTTFHPTPPRYPPFQGAPHGISDSLRRPASRRDLQQNRPDWFHYCENPRGVARFIDDFEGSSAVAPRSRSAGPTCPCWSGVRCAGRSR